MVREETAPEELSITQNVASILVQVDRQTYYETLVQAAKSVGPNGTYAPGKHDCVSFVDDIVKSIAKRNNLAVVPRGIGSLTPALYLDKLIAANPYWKVTQPVINH